MPYHRGPRGVALGSVWRQRERGKWERNFFVVSMGRNREGRVSRFGIWVVWIISAASAVNGLSLVVWCMALGWLGQVDGGPECESILKEIVGV